MITEELRPRKPEDVIGNRNVIERIIFCVQMTTPVLVYGPPGVGKTSTIYAIAKKYGYVIYEVNASDERRKEEMEKIFRLVRGKTLRPTIFLFDEVDGMSRRSWRILHKMLRKAVNPIVLIANEEWRIPEYIKKECEVIRFFRPSKRQILEHVKKIAERHNLEIKDYSKITKDVRNSILALIYGADTYAQTTEFDIVKRIFEGNGNLEEVKKDKKLLIWLLDNASYFYPDARELYRTIQLIALTDITKRTELLTFLPRGRMMAEPEFPYFLRRVSGYKRRRK